MRSIFGYYSALNIIITDKEVLNLEIAKGGYFKFYDYTTLYDDPSIKIDHQSGLTYTGEPAKAALLFCDYIMGAFNGNCTSLKCIVADKQMFFVSKDLIVEWNNDFCNDKNKPLRDCIKRIMSLYYLR